ncbi:hypothetical protein EON65_04600 [archaeon]|nr:MAG: hypothetical protein EON65_04600 [archaeon]
MKLTTHQGWLQTKLAGRGAVRGLVEIERAIEMVMLGMCCALVMIVHGWFLFGSCLHIPTTNCFEESLTNALQYQLFLSPRGLLQVL